MMAFDEERWPLTAAYLRWDLEVLCDNPDAVKLLAYTNELVIDRLIRAKAIVDHLTRHYSRYMNPALYDLIDRYTQAQPT